MKDLLTFIVQSIVNYPDQVAVREETNEEGDTVFTISVHPEDMGVVIGKSGRTIQAIRSLVRIKAVREGARIRIEVEEPEGSLRVQKPTAVEKEEPGETTAEPTADSKEIEPEPEAETAPAEELV